MQEPKCSITQRLNPPEKWSSGCFRILALTAEKILQEALEDEMLPLTFSKPWQSFDPMPIVQKHALKTPVEAVLHFQERLLPVVPDQEKAVVLLGSLVEGGKLTLQDPESVQRIRHLVHLIMSMPEFQLN
ncbi:MAG: hypothetical protein M5U26_27815 [Planctomycetota bacterium]|nr:hypothetical protein [Planctomycetota bacterium]